MNELILAIGFLAILAGVVAYVGDVLGSTIGKKRLSLFGFRPKQTGRLIGILAGILIMALTLLTVFTLFSNIQTTILAYPQLSIDNSILEQQKKRLESQSQSLQDQLNIQRESLAQIEADSARLQEANTKLSDLNSSLQGLNDQLSQDIRETQSQLTLYQNSAILFEEALQERSQQLTNVLEQIRYADEQGFAYTTGEVIHSQIIDAQEEASIRNALTQFMIDARNKVTLQGAESIKPLSTDDTEFLILAILETPNSDVLIFRSPENQVRSAREVDYFRDLVSNEKILTQGQLITSQQLHLGSVELPVERDEIVAELSRLSVTARQAMLRLNALSDLELETSSLSPDFFAEQLLRLKGPVTIGMIASDDIFVAGPAKLEYAVIY